MVKEKFIILRKIKYAEADLILHAISTLGEKKSFIARGALKSKKRFNGGILEPIHFVELSYKDSGDTDKLNALTEAILIQDFSGIKTSYEKLDFALKTLDCVSRVSLAGDRNSEFLFNLLGHCLQTLSKTSTLEILQLQFYLKFLLQQGVIPSENWMEPFLRNKISEGIPDFIFDDEHKSRLQNTEIMVQQYIRNAAVL